jgi:hypothetical protein
MTQSMLSLKKSKKTKRLNDALPIAVQVVV